MPEATIDAPTTEQPQLSGIDRFMSEVTAAAAAPEGKTAEPPPKTTETPKADPAKAPEAKAAPAATPPKTATEKTPATPPKEDGGTLRRKLEDALKSEKSRLSEIESLKRQNEELSKKRFVTPEMEKEIEDNKKQIAEYRKQIAEAAYERSDDFKKRFIEPWESLKTDTLKKVEQLVVTNAETGESRRATAEDFMRVAAAPFSERAAVAEQLFGKNALLVLTRLDKLESITEASNQAIREHREQYDAKQREESTKFQESQKQMATLREQARTELVQKYPQVFGDDPDDPESNEAMKKGYEFLDNVTSQAEQMPPEDQAAVAEVVRARAAWFPRGYRQLTKAQERIKTLEAELAKYRASDPGSETKPDARGEAPKKSDDGPKGVEALAERMERIARGETV